MSEHDAHRALTDTARLRALPDPLEDTQPMPVFERRHRAWQGMVQSLSTQPRERRKPSTVGKRQPQPDGSVDNARQAVVDFINDQQGDL